MSLVYHFPLYKNAENYGSTDVSIEDSYTKFVNDGKFGRALLLQGNLASNSGTSAIYLLPNPTIDKTKPFSISCWFYVSSITNHHNNPININDFIKFVIFNSSTTSSALQIQCYALYGGSYSYISVGDVDITNDTWFNAIVTFDGTNTRFYYNGTLKKTYAVTFQNNMEYIDLGCDINDASMVANERMRDFRLYDHVLTKKEINMLQKPLIASYNFGNSYNCVDESSNGGVCLYSGCTNNTESYNGTNSIYCNGSTGAVIPCDLLSGDHTFVMWVKPIVGGATKYMLYNKGQYGIYITSSVAYVGLSQDVSISYTMTDDWNCIVVVYSGTSATIYLNGELVSTMTGRSAMSLPYRYFGIGGSVDANGNFTGSGNCYISSFKIYAYAMGEKDAKEQYTYGAVIDNGYNMYVGSTIEASNTSFSLRKDNLSLTNIKESTTAVKAVLGITKDMNIREIKQIY